MPQLEYWQAPCALFTHSIVPGMVVSTTMPGTIERVKLSNFEIGKMPNGRASDAVLLQPRRACARPIRRQRLHARRLRTDWPQSLSHGTRPAYAEVFIQHYDEFTGRNASLSSPLTTVEGTRPGGPQLASISFQGSVRLGQRVLRRSSRRFRSGVHCTLRVPASVALIEASG